MVALLDLARLQEAEFPSIIDIYCTLEQAYLIDLYILNMKINKFMFIKILSLLVSCLLKHIYNV
jgi:hypothetical protein